MENQLYPLKLYLKSLPNRVILSLWLVLNFTIWGWLIWHIQPQQDPIFLHYNILFGVGQLGPWWKLYLIPVLGLIIGFVNGTIGWVTFHKDKHISYFLNATTVLCHLFLGISTYLLVFLNT